MDDGLPEGAHRGLTHPTDALATPPDRFSVRFETTEGPVVVDVRSAWAPRGAMRFYNLVEIGFFEDAAFFRTVDGFMAQFGIHAYPEVSKAWENQEILDDPVKASNRRGRLTFAMSGPDTRSTQLFFNTVNNPHLDELGFTPIGEVVEGLEVIDALYSGYGEPAPHGSGPSPGVLHRAGNPYLRKNFPELDYIHGASVIPE